MEYLRGALVDLIVSASVGLIAVALGATAGGAFAMAVGVGVVGLLAIEVWRRHPLALRRARRQQREGNARRSVRQAIATGDVAARIGELKTIHTRGAVLASGDPTEEQASAWLNGALGPLMKPERWSVLHAPPVHSAAEVPSEVKRRLEDQVQALRDVIAVVETRLYGLQEPRR